MRFFGEERPQKYQILQICLVPYKRGGATWASSAPPEPLWHGAVQEDDEGGEEKERGGAGATADAEAEQEEDDCASDHSVIVLRVCVNEIN